MFDLSPCDAEGARGVTHALEVSIERERLARPVATGGVHPIRMVHDEVGAPSAEPRAAYEAATRAATVLVVSHLNTVQVFSVRANVTGRRRWPADGNLSDVVR